MSKKSKTGSEMHEMLCVVMDAVISGQMEPIRASTVARLVREDLRLIAERRKVLAAAEGKVAEDMERWAKN